MNSELTNEVTESVDDAIGGSALQRVVRALRGHTDSTWTVGDLGVAGIALLFTTLHSLPLSYPTWTPRFGLLILLTPVGIYLLIRDALARDRAAQIGVAVSAWVVVAAIATDVPRAALVGFVGTDLSALIVVASISLWAVARNTSDAGRRLTLIAMLAGLSLSLIVGLAQLAFDTTSGPLTLNGGRPTGLTPNPVYFGGTMVAATAACLAIANTSVRWRMSASILGGCFAAGAAASGSRVAVIGLIVVAFAAIVWWRGAGLRTCVWLIGGFVVGVQLQRVFGRGADAVARVGSKAGLDGRREVWEYSLSAISDRPVFGWGFGRFQSAVQGRYTPDFVSDYARIDLGVAWFDAHNVVLALAVAIGMPGLALVVAWAIFAVRPVTVVGGFFLAGLAATWLLQPVSLATLPLAMLVLGTTTPRVDLASGHEGAHARDRLGPVLVAVGSLACGFVVLADVNLKVATDNLQPEAVERAASWYPGDPVVADLVAQVWSIANDDIGHPQAIEWERRAAERDPERPYYPSRVAQRLIVADDLDGARRAIEQVQALQPNHYQAARLSVLVETRTGTPQSLARALEQACAVDAPECADGDASSGDG